MGDGGVSDRAQIDGHQRRIEAHSLIGRPAVAAELHHALDLVRCGRRFRYRDRSEPTIDLGAAAVDLAGRCGHRRAKPVDVDGHA
jgi:hypothetical protein